MGWGPLLPAHGLSTHGWQQEQVAGPQPPPVTPELVASMPMSTNPLCATGGPLVYKGASVTMNSKALNGSQRVVVDGALSAEECQELQRLANVSARMGGAGRDGWRMLRGPILQLRHQTSNSNRVLQAAASAGDGYRGKTSPHTPSETFYGVTVLKALKVGVLCGETGCGDKGG